MILTFKALPLANFLYSQHSFFQTAPSHALSNQEPFRKRA
uniref:Uncharacterized protein n=1 Tax=Siphoviridae sp. ctUlD12 TaxID=2826354 RepID=A0A8S5MLP4_9CAUD|nr:MAG TPA: hypothetical protein [Siphoviridae sp. ctUlD12]